MACLDCKQSISTEALACPRCGRPTSTPPEGNNAPVHIARSWHGGDTVGSESTWVWKAIVVLAAIALFLHFSRRPRVRPDRIETTLLDIYGAYKDDPGAGAREYAGTRLVFDGTISEVNGVFGVPSLELCSPYSDMPDALARMRSRWTEGTRGLRVDRPITLSCKAGKPNQGAPTFDDCTIGE